jgi:predicted O-methyltransferase YrrM
MNLASLWALGGLASAASRAFASALALAPRDARAHRDAGIGLVAVGEHAAARAALVRALDLDPALLGARLALARLCGDTGDPEAWEHHARLAIESAPHDASAHLELHRALFDDQALAPCIEAARQAVALDPGYALARLFLAGALLHEGRRPEADLALGPPGLLAPGLRDALDHATRDPARNRCFSAKERTLRFALAQCTLPGVVIELGVRHGVSTRVLAAHGAEKIHGFDSFTGLPEAWQHRAPGAFSTAGELPAVPPAVSLHVGLFADTLPPFARTLDGSIRMLHIDSDLYESALTGLVCLAPHIVPGTIIVLDEYLGNASWRQDEHRALAEAAAHFGWSIEELSLGWITGQGVVQVRERA